MSRSADGFDPRRRSELPLWGRDPLRAADVAAIIRPDFHEDPASASDPAARARIACQSAAWVALAALAGLKETFVARMKLNDYDAGSRMIRIKAQTRELELPVTPALRHVLDQWCGEHRPRDMGEAMFPTGAGFHSPAEVAALLGNLGRRLGARRHLATLLAEFHRANLAEAAAGAHDRYWGVRPSRKLPPAPTGEALRALVEAADPFGPRIGFLKRPHTAAHYLRRSDTEVPAAAHLVGRIVEARRLACEDPLVAILQAANAKGLVDKQEALDRLFATWGADIDRAAVGGVALHSMAKLCGCHYKGFRRRLQDWRCGIARTEPRPRRAVRPPRHRPDVDERQRLERIAATAWPEVRGAREKLRRELLAQHFAFVRKLLAEGKITYKAVRPLFRLTTKQVTLRVFDLDNGVLHLATGRRPTPRERQLAQVLALREYAASPGQSLTGLWKRLRLAYAYPLDYPALGSIVRNFVAGRHKRRAGVPSPPPLPAAA